MLQGPKNTTTYAPSQLLIGSMGTYRCYYTYMLKSLHDIGIGTIHQANYPTDAIQIGVVFIVLIYTRPKRQIYCSKK
jgi:hypothetical protein